MRDYFKKSWMQLKEKKKAAKMLKDLLPRYYVKSGLLNPFWE
jgi:hypothetical protein